MQRSKVEALADCSFYISVYNDGFGEFCSAVEHAVTDCVDLINRSDDAAIFVGQSIEYELNSNRVVWHWGLNNVVVFARNLVGQNRTVDTDSFTQTFGENVFVLHVDQLILQRRAATV